MTSAPRTSLPGGTFPLAADVTVTRIGYGSMQLPGPGVMGPPRDRDEALAVLRTARELGINHIDTADFYGPHVSNELIREAFAPYPEDLHIVTKVGAERDEQGNWLSRTEPDQLKQQVHENLRTLGVDVLDVVNLRVEGGGDHGSYATGSPVADRFAALAELQQEGLIKHLGLSTVNADQVAEAQTVAPVVCVQNIYNLAVRGDDDLIDSLAAQGIAFVPFFPLGGFSPLQADELHTVAARLDTTSMAVALAWLLQRSPNVLLIPGTSSQAHLRDNVAGAGLELDAETVAELNAIAG